VDERSYFGHGVLGVPYADPNDDRLRFADVIQYEPFPELVRLRDPLGNYYETGTPAVPRGSRRCERSTTSHFIGFSPPPARQ
jgi:hypothetical protein